MWITFARLSLIRLPKRLLYAGLNGIICKIEIYNIIFSLIETGVIPNIMICWCGVDCTRCQTFRATIKNDDAMREAVKTYLKKLDITSK